MIKFVVARIRGLSEYASALHTVHVKAYLHGKFLCAADDTRRDKLVLRSVVSGLVAFHPVSSAFVRKRVQPLINALAGGFYVVIVGYRLGTFTAAFQQSVGRGGAVGKYLGGYLVHFVVHGIIAAVYHKIISVLSRKLCYGVTHTVIFGDKSVDVFHKPVVLLRWFCRNYIIEDSRKPLFNIVAYLNSIAVK